MVHVDHDARKSLILLLDNTILIWFNLVQRTIYIPLFTYHYYIGRYSGNINIFEMPISMSAQIMFVHLKSRHAEVH